MCILAFRNHFQQKQQAPKPVQPQVIAQPTIQPVPAHIAQNQDGAQIWMNIIAAIPSLPTRAFYSGVAKLVGIEDKKIKLGFLNDAVLTGAKTPAKLTLLENAMNATYPGYSIEFIRIDANTKVVEVKPKIAPAAPPRPAMPTQAPVQNQNPAQQANAMSNQEEEEEQTSAAEKRQFSPAVQNMIEQFNGRIID